MSTAYEHAFETLRDFGGKLTSEVPSSIDWPDDLVERVTGEVVDGFDSIKHAVAPAASVAVDAGSQAAVTTTRFVRRHPVMVVSGAVALVAIFWWFARRRADERASRDAHTAARVSGPSTVA